MENEDIKRVSEELEHLLDGRLEPAAEVPEDEPADEGRTYGGRPRKSKAIGSESRQPPWRDISGLPTDCGLLFACRWQ